MKHERTDISRLAAAHEFVASMVADRPDGAAYLPLFNRLEKELEAVAAQESAIERARRISRARATA
ncbi:hypothetical protein [Roseovarius halotolerans]|uniref:hypothetical protein n=1 Tax=Roseovarius halotolerans TaxID=505353 RepID=UPI00111BD982|nr:hypothetical protein [Roseovarius halotolerans]